MSFTMTSNRITSRAKLEALRTEDGILCLLCDRWFQILGGTHIQRFHGMALEEYRAHFNIPQNFALASEAYLTAARERCVLPLVTKLSKGLVAFGQSGNRRSLPDYMRAEAAQRARERNAQLTPEQYREIGQQNVKLRSRTTTGQFA